VPTAKAITPQVEDERHSANQYSQLKRPIQSTALFCIRCKPACCLRSSGAEGHDCVDSRSGFVKPSLRRKRIRFTGNAGLINGLSDVLKSPKETLSHDLARSDQRRRGVGVGCDCLHGFPRRFHIPACSAECQDLFTTKRTVRLDNSV
jgi:hypothetical protein